MSVAREEGLALSLTASPVGILLYERLRFEKLGGVVIQVLDEAEKMFLEAMVLDVRE